MITLPMLRPNSIPELEYENQITMAKYIQQLKYKFFKTTEKTVSKLETEEKEKSTELAVVWNEKDNLAKND